MTLKLWSGFRYLLLCLGLSLPAEVLAGVTAKAILEQTADGYFLNFGQGYRAQLFVGTLPQITFQTRLKVADTTCGELKGEVACTYETKYGMNKVNWLWINHPDKKQIGQPITYKKAKSKSFRTLDGNTAFNTFYAPLRHSSVNKTPADLLRCNRYDWIPKRAGEKHLITTWYSSNMATNSETNATENRALFALVGVHFKMENGTMMLADYDEVQAFSDFFINPFWHDQQSMIFNHGTDSCQVNWTRQVPVSENKKYFTEQMRPITEESPIPVKQIDYFTGNQIKAATYEFTMQEVLLR